MDKDYELLRRAVWAIKKYRGNFDDGDPVTLEEEEQIEDLIHEIEAIIDAAKG